MSSIVRTAVLRLLSVIVMAVAGQQAVAGELDTITIKVGFGAGGGYDASARLVSRHIGRFLPHNPSIVVQNVPGGGSMRLTRLLLGGEPADGSVIGVVASTMAIAPELQPDIADFDPRDLQWIGATTRDRYACITPKASGIATVEDFLSGEFIVGASGRSSLTYMMAAMVRNGLAAKFDIVTGFDGTADIMLAMQRGEVAASCGFPLSSLEDSGMMDEFAVIGRFGSREDGYPAGTPRFSALIDDPVARDAAELIEAPLEFHHPFAVPAGTPPDLLDMLRRAFAEMAADPEFLADARRTHNMAMHFTPGKAMEDEFSERLSADPAVFTAARELVR